MEYEMDSTYVGAYGTGGGIILFCLMCLGYIWWTRSSRYSSSHFRPFMEEARTIVQKTPGRWRKATGKTFDKDLELGTFLFCTTDCSWKGTFVSQGQSTTLTFEYGGNELRLSFRDGELLGLSTADESLDREHVEVRSNKPLARKLLNDVRKAVGFSVIEQEEVPPKVLSKNIPKPKEKKRKARE